MTKHESELIDQRIDALLSDPAMLPPNNMDAELAQFIGKLAAAEAYTVNENLTPSRQARVWRKSLSAAQTHNEQLEPQAKRERLMTAASTSLRSRVARFPDGWALPSLMTTVTAAVVGLLLLLLATAASRGNNPGNPDGNGTDPGSANVYAQQGTATALPVEMPTVVATATPSANDSVYAEATRMVAAMTATVTATPIGDVRIELKSTPTIIPTALPPTVLPPIPQVLPPAEVRDSNTVITDSLSADAPVKVYEFRISEDGVFSALLASANFPAVLSYQYTEAGSSGGGGGGGGGSAYIPQSQIIAYVRQGGVLTVVVSGTDPNSYGEFQLSAFQTTPQTLRTSVPATITLDGSQQVWFYTFQSRPGSLVDLSVTGKSNVDLSMVVVEVPTMQGALAFTGMTSGCLDSINTYCQDEDSGEGANPELTGVLIRSAVLHAVILRPAYPLTEPIQPSEVVLRLEERNPLELSGGRGVIKLSSQVRSDAVTLAGTAGTPIALTVSSPNTIIPVNIYILQGGYVLHQFQLSGTQTIPIVPALDDTIVVMAQYASQEAGMTAVPPLSIAVSAN